MQVNPFVPPELNSEVFVIPTGDDQGRFLVYAPLRRSAFVTGPGGIQYLERLRDGEVADDVDPTGSYLEILKRLEIVGAKREEPPITRFEGSPEPTALTLFLTTACNLRCTYCYASAGDTPKKFMPFDVAKRGIEFVAANALKRGEGRFEIAYHGGGEPSVNFPVMRDSFRYARELAGELGLGLRATSATNGVMSGGVRDWIIEHLDGVSLSFDGLPEVHDAHRVTVAGRGSSREVVETINEFDRAGFPYGLRLTVMRDQISKLPASIEFLCTNFSPQRIQAEPAYQIGRGADAPSSETSEFVEAFREAWGIADALGFELSYSGTRLDSLSNHFCGITQDSFALSTDGKVTACYEAFSEDLEWSSKFFYGNPTDGGGYEFDMDLLEALRRQSVDRKPFCQGCFAKWSCSGDCYHKALTVQGDDGEFRGTERCNITRELTKDLILARIEESGGLFWHEPDPRHLDELKEEEIYHETTT